MLSINDIELLQNVTSMQSTARRLRQTWFWLATISSTLLIGKERPPSFFQELNPSVWLRHMTARVQFLWKGVLPALKNIQVTTCPSIGSEIENESLIVNAKNRGIANIAVYLAPSTTSVLKVHPMYDRTADAKVELQMKHGRFLPRILLMRTSQVMNQVNKDSIGHNAKIDFFDNSPG